MTQPVPTPPPGDPAPTPPTNPPADPAPTATPPADNPLGPSGERALAAEREARKELEKQLAPLKQLAEALGGKATGDGKTDLERLTERLTQHETELASERAARFRAEVAAAKGLTAQQAARLQGGTRAELEADADALLALFPAAPVTPPVARTPVEALRPGALPTGGGPSIDDQIAELKAKGDNWGAVALERSKLNHIERPR